MIDCPIAERIALQDAMIAYCYAIDDLSDNAPLIRLFTEDAVLDFSDIGLPVMEGRKEYRAFYDGVYDQMAHHTHYLTNFRLDDYAPGKATTTAYAEGMGRAKDGNEVHVHVRYKMEFAKIDAEWKISKYWIFAGMPPPASLTEIHSKK